MRAFTTAMETNLEIVDSRLEKMNLPEQIAADRRAQLVAKSGFYELGADCVIEPSALLTDFETLSLPYFDERCKMVGVSGQGENVEFVVAPELDRAEAAKRTSADLKAYLDAISDLSATDQPTQVASQLAASLAALNKLAESAAESRGKTIDKDITNTVKAGSTLAETLAREGLEAMRYRALSAIVRDADPAVYEACLQLALWLAQEEDEAQKADLNALKDAEDAATERAVTLFVNGMTDEAGLSILILKVDEAYGKMAERDRTAKWRVFISAAQAHRALRDAFDRPADIETAAMAQARLDTLVRQTIAFVEAAENL